MRYAIWTICFGLLFMLFLSAPSRGETKAEEVQQYCADFKSRFPEALQNDAEVACARHFLADGEDA